MQISTKTGYALRALVDLALRDDEKPVSVSEICKKQMLPAKYIEQIFRKLKKKGLIKSIQGTKGGYILAQKTEMISLKDIMQAVDESYKNTYCDHNMNSPEYCSGLPCGFHELWDEIKNHIDQYFDSMKLDQIIKSYIEEK